MYQEVVFHLVGDSGVEGESGGSFVHQLLAEVQLLTAFLFAAATLLPQTSTCASASCWVSITNYLLFFTLAWCVSQHRMSAAFHEMGLCQLVYDHMSAFASSSLCREEFKNVYNLVFMRQSSPVVPVYITPFPLHTLSSEKIKSSNRWWRQFCSCWGSSACL